MRRPLEGNPPRPRCPLLRRLLCQRKGQPPIQVPARCRRRHAGFPARLSCATWHRNRLHARDRVQQYNTVRSSNAMQFIRASGCAGAPGVPQLTAGRMPSSARSTIAAKFMRVVVSRARRAPTEGSAASPAPAPPGPGLPPIIDCAGRVAAAAAATAGAPRRLTKGGAPTGADQSPGAQDGARGRPRLLRPWRVVGPRG